jgi:hypothetical protein
MKPEPPPLEAAAARIKRVAAWQPFLVRDAAWGNRNAELLSTMGASIKELFKYQQPAIRGSIT